MTSSQSTQIINFIKSLYPENPVPLHAPRFIGREKEFLINCVDSTFVSSVGEFVNKFEQQVALFCGVKYAIATTNGTSALHLSLLLAGVDNESEVLTQAVTFVATANAIAHCQAHAIFVDSEKETLGMDPHKLDEFLTKNTYINDQGVCINSKTKRAIKACIPMHVFGHPVKTFELKAICKRFRIMLIEDAAEALGSYRNGKHVGADGELSTLSFNGNKIITCGGGGMVLTNDEKLAKRAKHISTTAKIPHAWEFDHDEVGFNYRLPNLNAALACAQMELLPRFIENKRLTASAYSDFFKTMDIPFIHEPENCSSNYWLNAILLRNSQEKETFLRETNENGVMTRPLWKLMPSLKAFNGSQTTNLDVAHELYDRVVCLPSSVRI